MTTLATAPSRVARQAFVKDRHSTRRPKLPDYAPQLFAFHEEFGSELRGILSGLPLKAGDRALDVACGDGIYAAWFAELVGPDGRVTAVDASRDWLRVARKTIERQGTSNICLRRADARKLPFEDGSFDLVWCAQSFYSLPEMDRCLAEMSRVLRPGGALAILEDDTLHHLLLPWPIDVELEVRAAELAAFRDESPLPARYYIGRWLTRVLRRAGLHKVRERAVASARQAPLSPAAKKYLDEYLQSLARRVEPRLTKSIRRRFRRLVDPRSRTYLLKQAGFVAICLDRVVWGLKR